MEIILAEPRGFCAGVRRAIDIVELSLQKFGTPIYVKHEIVHNKYVVEDLRSKGVVFVDEIEEVPIGATVIFSAHGVSKKVTNDSKLRNLFIIDATCPLVTKVHKEAQRNESEGNQVILIGHDGHPEVEGTSGQVDSDVILVESQEDVDKIKVNDPNKLSYVTQTTLSVDDTSKIIAKLKQRFPKIKGPGIKDICYATQNRQDSVKELTKVSDVILVIGSKNSSNSNRLRDLGNEMKVRSYLINNIEDIDLKWFSGVATIGLTAGASAPEELIEKIVAYLKHSLSIESVKTMNGIKENVNFKLPPEVIYSIF